MTRQRLKSQDNGQFPFYIIIAWMLFMFQFLFMVQSCLEESWTNYYWGLFFYAAVLGVTYHENIILFIKTKIGAKI